MTNVAPMAWTTPSVEELTADEAHEARRRAGVQAWRLPALPPKPIPTDLIKDIAMDIGKAVADHIETMYPYAVAATSKNMLLSVRNTVYIEILGALDITNEDDIRSRLEERKIRRRRHKAAWKRIREMPVVGDAGES